MCRYPTLLHRILVDFITTENTHIIPIEVKSGSNVHAKSLRIFRSIYSPDLAVRFSTLPLSLDSGLLNIPLQKAWLSEQLCSHLLSPNPSSY